MKKVYKIQSLFLLLILMFMTSVIVAEEHQKSFSESYSVNADAEVFISNQYGNVTIESWDKNEVVIEVKVSVSGKSEKEAKAILDKVNIELSGTASYVKAVTKISGNLNCRNCKFSINYDIKMPATNHLELKNSFGDAIVGNLSGSTEFEVSYGSLSLGKLENKDNVINMKFGDVEIDYLKAANMEMEYGSLEIGKAGYLDLYVRFASVEIGEVSELVLDGEYEGIEIGSVNMLRAKVSFMGIEIDELFDKLDLISSYGGIEITRVAGGFSSIDISSEFGGVELGISSSASYKLKAECSFGDIDFPESRAEIIRLYEKSFNTEVEAFIGDDKSSSATVIVTATNSGIEIY